MKSMNELMELALTGDATPTERQTLRQACADVQAGRMKPVTRYMLMPLAIIFGAVFLLIFAPSPGQHSDKYYLDQIEQMSDSERSEAR